MSIFPFINPAAGSGSGTKLPMFREYAYDFERRELLLKDGKTYLAEANEAIRIWIYFALATARYRYTAYDSAYGSEIEDQLVGQPMEDEVTRMELERYITETLMVNPYIEGLSDFDFILLPDGIKAEFRCLTVYGEDRISYEIKGVM